MDAAAWRVRFAADQPSPADREETAAAGGALIVPAAEQFTLVATATPAEAICIMAADGQASLGGTMFTPPWAE